MEAGGFTEPVLKMANEFSHVKDLTVGQYVALVQRIGGTVAVEKVLKNDDLAEAIADLIDLGAKSATSRFIVCDHFKNNSSAVKFYGFGANFVNWFFGKVEELTAVELPKYHHDLGRDSLDAEILADLGGEEAAEVTLAGVFELLKLQPHGEPGALLTNRYANIFYVKDVSGVPRAVLVCWRDDGWGIFASCVDDEERGAPAIVFSPAGS